METPQIEREEKAKNESSMTLIDKYEEDYKSSLASMEVDVKLLIENGQEMKGLLLFSEKLLKIIEIHESLNDLYAIIFNRLDVLEHYNSERVRQLGYEPEAIYEQIKDWGLDVVSIDDYVVDKLSKIGFRREHWGINARILTEIEYLIETLRILIEPEFIPFEEVGEVQGLENEQERQDRYVPSSVKVAVWTRDGGKCTECGTKEKLEYDHIIPVSKGGSNTQRNIQLLCERCNRKKSANIE